jgi:hypothetical protein
MPGAFDRYQADLVRASRRLYTANRSQALGHPRPAVHARPGGAAVEGRPIRRTRRRLALGALSTLTLALVVWTLLGPVHPSTSSGDTKPYQHPNTSLLRTFGVFARSGVEQNGVELPPAVATAMLAEGSKARGLEPQIARAVTVAGPYPVSIVPDGPEELCLMQTGIVDPGVTGASCGTIRDALEGKLIKHSTFPANEGGGSVLVGLASDANRSVEVTEAGGKQRQVPVRENIYELVGGSPQSVTLLEAQGQSVTQYVP